MATTAARPGIRRNLVYSTVLTCATYVFPLVVYPYVSRVLGVANVGLVGFIDSITTYFILFSMMGISLLGIRETARTRGDSRRLSDTFWSLLALHAMMTLVMLAGMAVATALVPQLRVNAGLMCVGMCKLVFNLFLVEWLYKGLEDFRYITLRTVGVRALYVAAVFLLVRSPGDTVTYYVLTMLVVVASALVDMFRARRFVTMRGIRLRPWRYLGSFMSLGVYVLLGSAYTTLNVVILGFVAGDTEVGYYTTAVKIIFILSSSVTAMVSVFMPRMSLLAAVRHMDEFRRYFRRCCAGMLAVTVPLSAVVWVWAPEIVMLLSGPGYEGAVEPLRVMILFMPVSGIGQLLVLQVLTPLGRDRSVLAATFAGALTGVVLNSMLVPAMYSAGSAWVWSAGETVLCIAALLMARHSLRHC